MTIQTAVRIATHAGDDLETAFAYAWKIWDSDELVVTLVDASSVETVQVIGSDYTLDGVGADEGGTVNMTAAPATGETLRLERILPMTQLVKLRTQGAYRPESIEEALDRLTAIAQQINETASAGSAPEYTTTTRPTASADWAGKWITLKDSGQPARSQICLEKDVDDEYSWVDGPSGEWA